MANHAHHANDHSHTKHVDNPGNLIAIFIVLAALCILTLYLSTVSMGNSKLMVQMGIGAVQAVLVGYYFMHLRHADKVTVLSALAALFWTSILFILFLSDYLTRKYGSL